MQQTITVTCQAFRKNSDGSWTSVQVTDIYAPIGAIRIGPGMMFRRGGTFYGIDVVALLDQYCGQSSIEPLSFDKARGGVIEGQTRSPKKRG